MGPTLTANVGVREVRLLGRIASLTKDGYVWEADPKAGAAAKDAAKTKGDTAVPADHFREPGLYGGLKVMVTKDANFLEASPNRTEVAEPHYHALCSPDGHTY